MDEKKLIIKPLKYGGGSALLSVRMPKDMLKALDTVAAESGRTRNELIVQSIEFALESMEIEKG